MSTLSEELISPAVLDQAVAQAFSLLVGHEPLPSKAVPCNAADDVSLAVYCDQDQQSVVLVRCSRALASTFAERMLELPPDEVQENDLVDATGEIVNVIAGTLRGLLPTVSAMSAPFQVPADDLEHLRLNERLYAIDTETFRLSTAFNY